MTAIKIIFLFNDIPKFIPIKSHRILKNYNNFPLNKKITQDKELPYTLKINCFNEMEFPTILFAIGHKFLIKCRLFNI